MTARDSNRGAPKKRPPIDVAPAKAVDSFATRCVPWAVQMVVTIVAFAPVLGNGFLMWDDDANVAKNPRMNPPTLDNVQMYWSEPYLGLYIPVTYSAWSGLALFAWRDEPDLAGISLTPWIFHAAVLLVHLVSVSAAYLLLRRLMRQRWPAVAGTMLIAIHPLQAEPVAWVTGMKDVLSGCFRCCRYGNMCVPWTGAPNKPPGKQFFCYLASLVFFGLAVLSKPSAVIIPLEAAIIDFALIKRPWKKVLESVSPFLALAIAFGYYQTTRVQIVETPADGGRWWLRLLIAADAIQFYLGKLVYPRWLGFHYDRSPMAVVRHGLLYFTWIVPVAVATTAVAFRRRWPFLLPAMMIFIIALLPVLGLVPFSYQRLSTVADRYAYLALLGPALALSAALARLHLSNDATASTTVGSHRNRAVRVMAGLMAITAILVGRTFVQTFVFRNDKTFFTNGLTVNPKSPDAWGGLAVTIAQEKQFDAALTDAQHGVDLAPDYGNAYVNLATVYELMGKHDLARATFEKALNVSPFDPDAETGLSGVLSEQGKYADAEQHARLAIRVYFDDAQAHVNLSRTLYHTNQLPEAIFETRQAAAMDPGNGRAQAYYAQYLQSKGRHADAARAARIAMKLEPDVPEIQQISREIIGAK